MDIRYSIRNEGNTTLVKCYWSVSDAFANIALGTFTTTQGNFLLIPATNETLIFYILVLCTGTAGAKVGTIYKNENGSVVTMQNLSDQLLDTISKTNIVYNNTTSNSSITLTDIYNQIYHQNKGKDSIWNIDSGLIRSHKDTSKSLVPNSEGWSAGLSTTDPKYEFSLTNSTYITALSSWNWKSTPIRFNNT